MYEDYLTYDLAPLNEQEQLILFGGADGWENDLAYEIGRGAGYALKKLWKLFQFMSKNLYELQANTQVIYK